MMIPFIEAAVGVIVHWVRWLGKTEHGSVGQPQVMQGKIPIDLLEERFARSDISGAAFDERRRVLGY